MKQFRGNIYLIDDNFETKINGAILTIENNDFEVEFPDDKYRRSDYNIIQGEFIDLGFVTLIDCMLSGTTMSIVSLTKYRVQHIVTEIKFDDFRNIIASGLNVKMPSLKEWINKSCLKGHLIFDNKIEYVPIEKILLFQNEEFSIHISFHLQKSSTRNESINIEEYCELQIKSKAKSVNIFELYNVYKHVKMFLGFIGVFSKQRDKFYLIEENIIHDNQTEPLTMKFYTRALETNNNSISVHGKVIFDDIQEKLDLILNRWISDEKLQDSIVLVMEKYTFIRLTVETYFLNTCFAIETFHRKNKFNKVYPTSEFNKIKKSVRSKLNSEDEIKLFNDKLIFANEPTFSDRLKSLKKEFEAITDQIDIDDYISKIVKTRNYLVHRGSKTNILKGLEIFYAALYLETLTKYCIMGTIGIEKETLDKIFAQTGKRIGQFYEQNVNRKTV